MKGAAAIRRALSDLELDERRLRVLRHLCGPEKHGGAVSAATACAYLDRLLAALLASPAPQAARKRPARRRKGAKAAPAPRTGGGSWAELNDDISDLWAAG